ncbi:hypothetical protein ACFX1X_032099 [Malus domestica]
MGSLQAYEEKHKKRQWNEEQLFKMHVQPKKKEESFDNERSQYGGSHGRERGRGHGRGRGWNFNNHSNYERGESSTKGHGRGRSNLRAPSNRLDEKVNYVKEKKEENGIVLLAYKNNDGDQDYTWYLDTGANNHMCRRSMFVELNESVNGNVSFRDESKIPVKGKKMTKED